MAKKTAKVLEINETTKKIRLDKEKDEITIGKKILAQKPFSVGDSIEYEIKGPNFNFIKKVSSEKSFYDIQNKSKGNNKKIEKEIILQYPYNFVSLGNKDSIKRKPYTKGNNSGKLICRLINKTPIFTTGETIKDTNGHTREYFLKEKDKYIIPSSSIKGEIRNIIEVLTNSCIKNVSDESPEKRLNAGFSGKKYGFIKRLPTSETSGLIKEARVTKISRELLNEFSEIRNGRFEPKEGFYNIKVSKQIKNFETKYDSKERKYKNILENKKDFENLRNHGTEDAILWISSNIFGKKYEKILWDAELAGEKKIYEFSKEDYDDLQYLIDQRNERDSKNGKNFYLNKIGPNEVLIFRGEINLAKDLTFSEIPRLRYAYSPLELVPKEYKPCKNINELCFACGLFGSTGDQQKKGDQEENTSCQGKVLFTDATIEKNKAMIQNEPVALKPLGEPHISLWRFYLKNAKNEGYDSLKSEIRGRKFYWHHSDKLEAGKNIDKYLNTLKFTEEKYNSSLQFMNPENTFDFEVRFNNLTDEELGILIYSLELEEGLLHKFGKAKAFGFGSSKIIIDKFLLDSKDKYKSFIKTYDEGDKEEYLQIAKNKYVQNTRLEIKELKAILNKKNSLNFKESPFPEEKDKKGNKNTLEWFKNHKNVVLGNILDK